jgi:hypothetical protein
MDAHTYAPVPRYAYSLDEAARSISLSRRALYNLVVAGTVRTVKLGTRRVAPATELARSVKTNLDARAADPGPALRSRIDH